MSYRSDKRDRLALIGAATDFDIDFRDGVVGSEVSDKALPPVNSLSQVISNIRADHHRSTGLKKITSRASLAAGVDTPTSSKSM